MADVESVVEMNRTADRVSANVDGVEYDLEFRGTGTGSYLLLQDGRVFDCRVEGTVESGKAVDAFVGTHHFAVTLTDPKRLRGSAGAAAHADEATRIIAPMPGKIVRVLVEVGSAI